MTIYAINKGEDPKVAHGRLTKEAFFPVVEQELFYQNQNSAISICAAVGGWSYDFTDRVKEPSFDIDEYLSEGCRGAAKSLRDIHETSEAR